MSKAPVNPPAGNDQMKPQVVSPPPPPMRFHGNTIEQAERQRLLRIIETMRIPLDEIWRRWSRGQSTVGSYCRSAKGKQEITAAIEAANGVMQ